MNTKNLVKASILSSIGYILMFISIPIPILFPNFLKIDVSDVTALLGGIALSPFYGVLICFIKNLLQVITGMSTTGGVGEFANFLIGASFVYSASKLFNDKFNLKKSLLVASIIMTIVGCLANYFIILPFYSSIMPITEVINMASSINNLVKDKITFIIFMIIPFNVLKSFLSSVFTILIYKKLRKIL